MSGSKRPLSRTARSSAARPGAPRRRVAGQPVWSPPDDAPPGEPAPAPDPRPDEPATPRRPASRAVTVALAVLIVVLLGIGGTEAWYLARDHDDVGSTTITADHPVVLSDVTVHSVVDQAAQAAKTILAVDYRTFDAQVAKAAALMAPPFAAKFKQTKADIRAKFVAQKASVSVTISNQGVVSASPDEVDVLLFLTEQTSKPTGSTNAQFRVIVTMTRSGAGWVVAKLQAL